MAEMSLFRRTVPGEFELCVLKDSMLQSEAKLYIECYETDETHDVSSLKVYSDTIKLGIPHCIPAKFTKSDLEKRILKCLEKIVETKTTTVAVNVDAVKTWNTTGFVYTLLKCFHDYAHTDPKWVYLRLTVCSIQQQVCESAKKACAEFLSILNDNASEDAEQALHSVQDFDPSKKNNMGVSKQQPDDINPPAAISPYGLNVAAQFAAPVAATLDTDKDHAHHPPDQQGAPHDFPHPQASATAVDKTHVVSPSKYRGIVFETFYHRSGKKFECIYQSGMRFYRDDKEWQPFPKRWYNEGILVTNRILKDDSQ